MNSYSSLLSISFKSTLGFVKSPSRLEIIKIQSSGETCPYPRQYGSWIQLSLHVDRSSSLSWNFDGFRLPQKMMNHEFYHSRQPRKVQKSMEPWLFKAVKAFFIRCINIRNYFMFFVRLLIWRPPWTVKLSLIATWGKIRGSGETKRIFWTIDTIIFRERFLIRIEFSLWALNLFCLRFAIMTLNNLSKLVKWF